MIHASLIDMIIWQRLMLTSYKQLWNMLYTNGLSPIQTFCWNQPNTIIWVLGRDTFEQWTTRMTYPIWELMFKHLFPLHFTHTHMKYVDSMKDHMESHITKERESCIMFVLVDRNDERFYWRKTLHFDVDDLFLKLLLHHHHQTMCQINSGKWITEYRISTQNVATKLGVEKNSFVGAINNGCECRRTS